MVRGFFRPVPYLAFPLYRNSASGNGTETRDTIYTEVNYLRTQYYNTISYEARILVWILYQVCINEKQICISEINLGKAGSYIQLRNFEYSFNTNRHRPGGLFGLYSVLFYIVLIIIVIIVIVVLLRFLFNVLFVMPVTLEHDFVKDAVSIYLHT